MRHRNTKPIEFKRGAWLFALTQRFCAPIFRFGAALLALLLFIAPTWHVCALGGNAVCHDHTTQSASSEDSNQAKVLICGLSEEKLSQLVACSPSSHSAGEVCQCSDHKTSVASLSPVHPQHFDENCLARLLWNFPAALILLFAFFLLWSRRIARYSSTHITLVSAFSRIFEARGPPLFSPL